MLAARTSSKDLMNLVTDRLRVNKLVRKSASWVASAMLRRALGRQSRPPARSRRPRRCAGVRRRAFSELMDLKLPKQWLARRSRHGGCLPAAARRGRAAPGAAAADRRRQASARRPALILKRLARAMTARGLVGDPNRAIGFNSVSVDPSYVACQRLSSPRRSRRTNSCVVQHGLLQLEGGAALRSRDGGTQAPCS
jgi:hypothetical protein